MSRVPERGHLAALATIGSVAFLVCAGAVRAQVPFRAEAFAFSDPETLARIDAGELKGEPSRLAWSPDGRELYLQMLEGGFGKPDAIRTHHSFTLPSGAREPLPGEPAWASRYWTAKSGRTSPDPVDRDPLQIELKSERRKERTTSLPSGGDLARGGGSPGITEADQINIATQQVTGVHSMVLLGETIGEFVNTVIVPGLTYGWAPEGTKLIAYVSQSAGRVVVMDASGAKKEVPGSRDALLPAWSDDLGRLAWLQKDGRKGYLLRVARVSVS